MKWNEISEFSLENLPNWRAIIRSHRGGRTTGERPGEFRSLIHGSRRWVPLWAAVLFLPGARLPSPKKPHAKRWRGRGNIAADTRVGEAEKGGEGKRKKMRAQKRNGERSGAREAAAGRHTVLICQPSLFAIEDIPHLDKHVLRLVPSRIVLNRFESRRFCWKRRNCWIRRRIVSIIAVRESMRV